MAVLERVRAPSLYRRVHRALMRNALRDLPSIIPATACHQRNYIERYRRFALLLLYDPSIHYARRCHVGTAYPSCASDTTALNVTRSIGAWVSFLHWCCTCGGTSTPSPSDTA